MSETSLLEQVTDNLHDAFQSLMYAGLWILRPEKMRQMPANQQTWSTEQGPALIDMYEERALQAVLALMQTPKPTVNDARFHTLVGVAEPNVGIMTDQYELDADLYAAGLEAYGKLRGEAECWVTSVAIMRNPYRVGEMKRAAALEFKEQAQTMIDAAKAAEQTEQEGRHSATGA